MGNVEQRQAEKERGFHCHTGPKSNYLSISLSWRLHLLLPELPHHPESLAVLLDGLLSLEVELVLLLHPGIILAKHVQHG